MHLNTLENHQLSFFLFIGILGVLALIYLVWVVLYVYRYQKELHNWRSSLRKRQLVRVDSLNGDFEFWRYNDDGTVVIRIHDFNHPWFKTVDQAEIWPLADKKIEWELV